MDKILAKHPVSSIEWVHREKLSPNFWNPNHVAPAEKDLIMESILENGWVFPILVNSEFMIMDGFHRWHLSEKKELYSRTEGMVPIATLYGLSIADSMILTIRINRAKGTHAVLKMADIVRQLIEMGLTKQDLMLRLGMEDEEVIRLADRAGMPERRMRDFEGKGFNNSFVPDIK